MFILYLFVKARLVGQTVDAQGGGCTDLGSTLGLAVN